MMYIDSKDLFLIFVAVLFISVCILKILIAYNDDPFEGPHIIIQFDVSGRHKPNFDDYVEEWIIALPKHGIDIKQQFDEELEEWDKECEEYISNCTFGKERKREFYQEKCKEITQDDYKMFIFDFKREQTRYRQSDYERHPYTVENTVFSLKLSLKELLERDDELEEIEYETTISKWNSRNQRKLMTKDLREKIKIRDNYTCQKCGKYMPDEVGLHIDHIIPVKLGGKSVESNLQVLCDKCNLKKGSNY